MSIALYRRRRLTWLGMLVVLAGISACDRTDPVFNSRFLAFGTLMDLSIIGASRERAQFISDSLESDFEYMHKAWHAWDPGPVTRTNRLLKEGLPFAAPPSILPLVTRSQELAEVSENLFNPAIGRLVNLWGFHTDSPECKAPPDAEKINALVARKPRMSDIVIDGFRLQSSNPAVQLDFGAFGKGYGIDMAIDRLREFGVRDAIIKAGGDLRAIGSRDGHPWRVAIRNPSGGGIFGFVDIQGDESVFTSGSYEHNYTWENKLFHHIIDPRSGYPAKDTASVTVIHTDATTADAAATALFVAGPDDWHRIATRMGIKYVLLVDARGKIHMNPRMRDRVQLIKESGTIVVSKPLLQGQPLNG